jgi:hypothetical protein
MRFVISNRVTREGKSSSPWRDAHSDLISRSQQACRHSRSVLAREPANNYESGTGATRLGVRLEMSIEAIAVSGLRPHSRRATPRFVGGRAAFQRLTPDISRIAAKRATGGERWRPAAVWHHRTPRHLEKGVAPFGGADVQCRCHGYRHRRLRRRRRPAMSSCQCGHM